MIDLELIRSISRPSPSRIVMLILDGLGGLPDPKTGKTELGTARTPNLDGLAAAGICGLTEPVGPGITPGSAPGHLALFGYDPINYSIGRGVLEAIGIGVELQPGDVAARGNFCTVDAAGLVTDRRAGRITTEKCAELCRLLDGQVTDGIEISVYPVREHRFVVVLHGNGISADVNDSDPQQVGMAPRTIDPLSSQAEKTASAIEGFTRKASSTLANHYPANMVLLRGFSRQPQLPTMAEIYKLRPAVIASYPMYRGLARLVGMEVLETGTAIEEEITTLEQNYTDYDFLFLHVKGTDSAGEDGDFARKVATIEQVDRALPRLLSIEPDVVVVTGDHSTPALLKGHSWHPVPVLLYSKWCRPDTVKEFSESGCVLGGLGHFPAVHIMPLAMANALKLNKYGA